MLPLRDPGHVTSLSDATAETDEASVSRQRDCNNEPQWTVYQNNTFVVGPAPMQILKAPLLESGFDAKTSTSIAGTVLNLESQIMRNRCPDKAPSLQESLQKLMAYHIDAELGKGNKMVKVPPILKGKNFQQYQLDSIPRAPTTDQSLLSESNAKNLIPNTNASGWSGQRKLSPPPSSLCSQALMPKSVSQCKNNIVSELMALQSCTTVAEQELASSSIRLSFAQQQLGMSNRHVQELEELLSVGAKELGKARATLQLMGLDHKKLRRDLSQAQDKISEQESRLRESFEALKGASGRVRDSMDHAATEIEVRTARGMQDIRLSSTGSFNQRDRQQQKELLDDKALCDRREVCILGRKAGGSSDCSSHPTWSSAESDRGVSYFSEATLQSLDNPAHVKTAHGLDPTPKSSSNGLSTTSATHPATIIIIGGNSSPQRYLSPMDPKTSNISSFKLGGQLQDSLSPEDIGRRCESKHTRAGQPLRECRNEINDGTSIAEKKHVGHTQNSPTVLGTISPRVMHHAHSESWSPKLHHRRCRSPASGAMSPSSKRSITPLGRQGTVQMQQRHSKSQSTTSPRRYASPRQNVTTTEPPLKQPTLAPQATTSTVTHQHLLRLMQQHPQPTLAQLRRQMATNSLEKNIGASTSEKTAVEPAATLPQQSGPPSMSWEQGKPSSISSSADALQKLSLMPPDLLPPLVEPDLLPPETHEEQTEPMSVLLRGQMTVPRQQQIQIQLNGGLESKLHNVLEGGNLRTPMIVGERLENWLGQLAHGHIDSAAVSNQHDGETDQNSTMGGGACAMEVSPLWDAEESMWSLPPLQATSSPSKVEYLVRGGTQTSAVTLISAASEMFETQITESMKVAAPRNALGSKTQSDRGEPRGARLRWFQIVLLSGGAAALAYAVARITEGVSSAGSSGRQRTGDHWGGKYRRQLYSASTVSPNRLENLVGLVSSCTIEVSD